MKINIPKVNLVTDDYKKLLWILEHNTQFEKDVDIIRKKYKNKDIPDDVVLKLMDDHKLPVGMSREMRTFLIKNSFSALFLEPGVEVQGIGMTAAVLLKKESPKDKKREVRISITSTITKNKFLEWVEKNWETIEFDMQALELPEVKFPRWENLDLAKQIFELRDVEKLTFSEITTRLKQFDEDYIKTLYHRYKKWFK